MNHDTARWHKIGALLPSVSPDAHLLQKVCCVVKVGRSSQSSNKWVKISCAHPTRGNVRVVIDLVAQGTEHFQAPLRLVCKERRHLQVERNDASRRASAPSLNDKPLPKNNISGLAFGLVQYSRHRLLCCPMTESGLTCPLLRV